MKSWKLSARLGISFGVLMMILMVVAILAYRTVHHMTYEMDQLISHEIAIEKDAAEVKTHMLQCRRSEKDFLMRKDMKYLDKVGENCDLLREHAAGIAVLAQEASLTDMQTKAEEIDTLAQNYMGSFQKVVDACKKAGIASGNHIASIEQLRYWMEQGMRMITYTYPPTMIINHSKDALAQLKEGF